MYKKNERQAINGLCTYFRSFESLSGLKSTYTSAVEFRRTGPKSPDLADIRQFAPTPPDSWEYLQRRQSQIHQITWSKLARRTLLRLSKYHRDVLCAAHYEAPGKLPEKVRERSWVRVHDTDIDLACLICLVNEIPPDKTTKKTKREWTKMKNKATAIYKEAISHYLQECRNVQ